MTGIILVALATLLGISLWLLPAAVQCKAILLVAVVLWVGLALLRAAATAQTRQKPRTATVLWQGTLIIPFAAVLLTSWATTGISLGLAPWLVKKFAGSAADPDYAEQVKTIGTLIVGAVNGLIAKAWLDTCQDPSSDYWPDSAHRKALKAAFATSPWPRNSSILRAIILDSEPNFANTTASTSFKASGDGTEITAASDGTVFKAPNGWGFAARWQRARLISRLTKDAGQTTTQDPSKPAAKQMGAGSPAAHLADQHQKL